MRAVTMIAILATSLISVPAVAQIDLGGQGGVGSTNQDDQLNGRTAGILATTPSRMQRSRREMNRGREPQWAANPTPALVRASAEEAIQRAGFHCTIADFKMVAHLRNGPPIVEVACHEGGGLVVANTENTVTASDCLDIVPGVGEFEPCALPANVARAAAAAE